MKTPVNTTKKVLEYAKKCTLFDGLELKDANFCIKIRFFNAVLGRIEKKYTQNDVAESLSISLRTAVELEKGNVDKLTLIFKYINLYAYEFAKANQKQQYIKRF